MKKLLQWIYGLNLNICRKQFAFFRKYLSLFFCNRIYQLDVLSYLLVNTTEIRIKTKVMSNLLYKKKLSLRKI